MSKDFFLGIANYLSLPIDSRKLSAVGELSVLFDKSGSKWLVQLSMFRHHDCCFHRLESLCWLSLHQFNIPEMLVVFAVSVLATVAIEMPFNEVYRIYFGKSQTKLKDK
ncbi:unnamed protein product [Plutella xylostella]|uniref:(diamondback moth) hypothetical protein n=1 Tax=Plutella xylostella TaxID=51655 RepID=A0A8S4D4V6_PLUXY|nr:unnamed protein product [Plutella xylostella]